MRNSTLASVLFTQEGGVHGTITVGPVFTTAGGFTGNWWQINWDSQPPNQGSTQGWCAELVISLAASGGDTPQPSFSSNYYTTANHFWTQGDAPGTSVPGNLWPAGAYGNCTWYAHGRMLQLGYSSTQLAAIAPPGQGSAYQWGINASGSTASALGVVVNTTPTVGSIAELDSGTFSSLGHVAVVESVNADGSITVTESSYSTSSTSVWNFLWHHRTVAPTWFSKFIHVLSGSTVQPPSIGGVSPTSYPASNTDQTLTINGNNFQSGATLTFDPPTGVNINSTASKLTFVSSSQITYQFNNGSDAGTWTVSVNNPDGKSSSPASFTVTSGQLPPGEPTTLGVLWLPSPNFNNRPSREAIDTIVIHTVQGSYESGKTTLRDDTRPLESRVSAHYIISPAGEITQLVQLEKRAWHATYYNDRSIGIEMAGFAEQSSTWNPQNLAALENLVTYLAAKYSSIHIVHPEGDASTYPQCLFTESGLLGHSQIQPGCNSFGTKTDPGSYFPWTTFVQSVQAKAGGVALSISGNYSGPKWDGGVGP